MSETKTWKDYTVLAVPCNQVIILSKKQGDELRDKIIKRRALRKKERDQVALKVKPILGKPGY